MSTPAHSKTWRERNRQYVNESAARHYWENRETILARHKTPEARARKAANMRKYRAQNPEKYRAYNREWWAKHPGLKAEKCKRAYESRKARGVQQAADRAKYQRIKATGKYSELLKRHRANARRSVERLSDCYVRTLILRRNGEITREQLPDELVALKRAHVELQRAIQSPRTKPRNKK